MKGVTNREVILQKKNPFKTKTKFNMSTDG